MTIVTCGVLVSWWEHRGVAVPQLAAPSIGTNGQNPFRPDGYETLSSVRTGRTTSQKAGNQQRLGCVNDYKYIRKAQTETSEWG